MPSMTNPSEFVLEQLREGADFTVYRGRQRGNPTPVLVVRRPLNGRRLKDFGGSNTNTCSQLNSMRVGR
jgi:hypothetical protein